MQVMKEEKKLTIIGSKTLVDFPDQALFGVPAKVDTGADSSSLWASGITEENGTVSFSLFDPSSPFYTGERIRADKFSVRSIKNSFGVSELRYKISLPIVLSDKKFKARFTLSNRKNTRYPILIGRQTLKNRFIVDVSRSRGSEKVHIPKKILVLVNNGSEKITSFYAEAEQRNEGKIIFEVRRYKDLVISFETGEATVKFIQDDVNIQSFDLIYFKTRVKNAEIASVVANMAKQQNIPYVDKVTSQQPTDKKVHQGALLAMRGLPVPKSIYMDKSHWENKFNMLEKELELPFIFKDNDGRKGRNNFLINSPKDFKQAIKSVIADNLQMIAQEYVPNDGYYRIVILGRQVAMAMHRKVDQKVSHLYNRDRDGLPTYVDETELSLDSIRIAVNSAEYLGLDVAGVDLIKDKDNGMWYCLEVNNSPQLSSGAFVTEKMNALTKYFVEEMDR